MKIIIIGSGIAGLTLAIACQRHGMDVTLYEKTKRLQHIGGGLLLWPHGLRYLKWLGLAECLSPHYVSVSGCEIRGHTGEKIFSENYAALYSQLGGEILPIDRSLLQHALLSQLSENKLQLGKSCVNIVSDEQQARVFFADGTQDHADIVVGADGIHSTVRQCMNINTTQQYTNYCWWGGIVDEKHAPFLPAHQAYIAMDKGKLLVAWPTTQKRFMWYLPVKMSMHDFNKGVSLDHICADWHEDIKRLIHAPTSAQRFHLPIHTLSASSLYTKKRIILIGDAAHTLGPILGQGASQAIEDAFLLFHCLKNMKNEDVNTLMHYENLRHHQYKHLAL
jgi:FAD-dependent urate hydroxylase